MVHILSRAKSAFLSMTTVFILEQMESVFKDKSDKVIPTFILLIIYCGHAYLRISFTAHVVVHEIGSKGRFLL